MVALTTVTHSYGNEASKWSQLYHRDPDFTTTYQLLGTCVNVTDFHIQDGFLCHLDHLCDLKREHARLIWEAHYNHMAGHFGMEEIVVILQKKNIGQKFDRTLGSIPDLSLFVSLL
jgi:hypothetical protein